jgi:uncharacterized protein YcnI
MPVAPAALGAGLLLAISAPLSASAHVSLEENTATPGTLTTLTFRVPNETADGASTNKLTLTFPRGKNLLQSISYVPVAGWATQLVTTKLAEPIKNGDSPITEAVTRVIWTATSGSVYGPGREGIFILFVGAVPSVGKLALPVDRGYTDGSMVSWAGGVASDHPAPVLYVNDKAVTDQDLDSAPIPSVTTTGAGSTAAGPDVLARILGGVGLVLGVVLGLVLGLVLGVVALLIALAGRRPRQKAS